MTEENNKTAKEEIEKLKQSVATLEAQVEAIIAAIPTEQQKSAFEYMKAKYDLTMNLISKENLPHLVEATEAKLSKLKEFIKVGYSKLKL